MKINGKQAVGKLLRGILTFTIIFGIGANAVAAKEVEPCAVSGREEIKVSSRFFELFFGKKDEDEDESAVYLCPAGSIFGVKIKTEGVSVTEITENIGLAVGDIILSIDGERVTSAADVGARIRSAEGSLHFVILRGEEEVRLELTPTGECGSRRLGIVVRDGAAGIGTITYINAKTGEFGGLGHGICDTGSGKLVEVEEGIVTEVTLGGVRRGEEGKPGELRGVLKNRKCGTVRINSDCGVFGTLESFDTSGMVEMQIGGRATVHEGRATILSTVTGGGVAEYEVSLSDIDPSSTGTKSFAIKVTDPTLLAITGGIVRGMSGSPIIQDGKLIGAVTHVMVANPTEGYGIFIENMLNASQAARNELPAA